MVHRIAGAALVALALGGASPAYALTRQAVFAWQPASGPVAGYAVYASMDGATEELVGSVVAPTAAVLVESSSFVAVRIAAFDSAGRLGPISDMSAPIRLCPGDFDGDEIIGIHDWVDVRSCFGLPGTGFCAGADMDSDGLVSLQDVLSPTLGANTCAPSFCLGDFDGDRLIGIWDYTQATTCLGLVAEGACAAADFDGNGAVSLFDVSTLGGLIGSDTCAL